MDPFPKWILFATCIMGIIYVLWNITEEDEEKPNRKKESPEMDLFIPTHEWKEVKPGQAIPPVKR